MLKWLGSDRLPLDRQLEELSRLASTLAFNRDGEAWHIVLCDENGRALAIQSLRGPRQLEVFTYGLRKLGYVDHEPAKQVQKEHAGDYHFTPGAALTADGIASVYARLTPW
jgi:hypothetical protein